MTEAHNQEPFPTPGAVFGALQEIEDHNRRSNAGKQLGAAFVSLFKAYQEGPSMGPGEGNDMAPEVFEAGMEDHKLGNELGAEVVTDLNTDLLNEVGIGVINIEIDSATGQPKDASQTVKIMLDSGKKFGGFVDSIDETVVKPEEAELVNNFANIMTIQATTEYEEQVFDATQYEPVLVALRKKGFMDTEDRRARELERVVNAGKAGYLNEYTATKESGFDPEMTDPEAGYNASTWYRDATPENYAMFWGNAVSTLEAVRSNPGAAILQVGYEQYLREAADRSLATLQVIQGNESYPEYVRQHAPEYIDTIMHAAPSIHGN